MNRRLKNIVQETLEVYVSKLGCMIIKSTGCHKTFLIKVLFRCFF